MESVTDQLAVDPPWEIEAFFTEEGLKAAQEYFFQTHATHTRMIAEGRKAQGVSKTMVRRKLSKELGDDFKMYTGSNIGEGGEADVSKGIRGELNEMLGSIYRRIAPTEPITSPTQEDLIILSHPHGGLEVCYAMVFFYEKLLRDYASVASNRRVVLRSIMDEELFKWIWRLGIAYMLAPAEAKHTVEDFHLSSGVDAIPPEKRKVSLGQKVYDVGMFLLSRSMQESKLRPAVCLYFVTYLRQLQSHLVISSPRREVEGIFQLIAGRMEGGEIEHPLVAVDALMNGKGTSMESFDDVLKNDAQISQLLPPKEADFINQFEDFGNPKRLAATLRKLVPDPRKELEGEQETTLMPLLLMLRTMPVAIRDVVMAKMPVPILNMLRNRLTNTTLDDVSKELVDRIKEFMDARRAAGESYTVSGQRSSQKAAVASSVRVSPPKSAGTPSASLPRGGADAPPVRAPNGVAAKKSAPPAPETAPETAPEPPAAQPPAQPTAQPPAQEPLAMVDEKALISWEVSGGRIQAVSISVRDLMGLAGKELRLLLPFVVFSLRTGQIFGLEPDQIKRETVEKLVRNLASQGAAPAQPALPREKVLSLLQAGKGASMGKLLLSLLEAQGLESYLSPPPAFAQAFQTLEEKFGERLQAFLEAPGDASFRDIREGLDGEEKEVLSVLHRVARAQS